MTSLTSPSLIHVGQHGTSASGFATIAWLEATPDDWPHVTQNWDETRAHVTHRHRIPVNTEILQSVEPETSIVKHRRQRALSNALHTISNQNIHIGSVYTRTTPDNHRTEQDALHTALLQQINTRLEDGGKFGILFTTTELSPPPKLGLHRILETATPPHTSAGTQMANIIAWAAHQHLTHHDQPNFCWDLYQDLRHIDIYGEPLAIDTETDWVDPKLASSNCMSSSTALTGQLLSYP